MNQRSELSEEVKLLLREYIHIHKEREYARGIVTGFAFGAFICVSLFMIYKLKQ